MKGQAKSAKERAKMEEVVEDDSAVPSVPPVSVPPMQTQYNSPSLSRKPLLIALEPAAADNDNNNQGNNRRGGGGGHNRNRSFFTPLGSPVRKAIQMTKLDPQDAWLPITESRNGNAYYAAFHTLCSGIGIQALVLPVSFTILGW